MSRLSAPEIVAHALDIARDYRRRGMTLTIRSVYYQLVIRGLLDNKASEAKRVQASVGRARLRGDYPWDLLVDTARTLHRHGRARPIGAAEALTSMSRDVPTLPDQWVHASRWAGQPVQPLVIIEKEAMVGVIRNTCDELQVPWGATRGYCSHGHLYAIGQELHRMRRRDPMLRRVDILYAGDHDPDGMEIPRSFMDGLDTMELHSPELVMPGRTLHRIALNPDQVAQLETPPFPAKETSSRYAAYAAEYGDDCYELDAMDPDALCDLIRAEVDSRYDTALADAMQDQVQQARDEARAGMTAEWFADAMDAYYEQE